MNLHRLAVFVAVAEAGSFTAAANGLGMTKSAVSQAVSLLERELGIPLMRRSTRALSLTDAGHELLGDARDLLHRAEALGDRARAGTARISGLLRITSTADSVAFIAPVIKEYLARYPEMRVEYLPSDQVLDPLREKVDLSLRISPMRDSTLRAVKLAEIELWLVASPDYLDGRVGPKKPEDLSGLDWIAFSPLPSPWTREFTVRSGRKVKVRFHGRSAVSSAAGVRALCLAGAGIASAADFMVRADVEAGRLVRLLPDAKQPMLYLHAAWTDRVEPPARTRAFIELAKLRLRKRDR